MHASEHLSPLCKIKYTEGKGRGVFASQSLPAYTTIEISPVLLFSKEEYGQHGKYTVLDHYTFVWPGGWLALALGLGSLFNHASNPNVSYSLEPCTDSIRYTTTRLIQADEELCIFYGVNLWFEPKDISEPQNFVSDVENDGWGGLLDVEEVAAVEVNPNEIIQEDDLPFVRMKLTPDDDEEEIIEAVRTCQAWVVDIPDPRHITTMLKWLKSADLDDPNLGHLKRIRKRGDTSTLLLSVSSEPPTDIPDILPQPYQLAVPKTAALTLNSQKVKGSLWPTIYAPRRKGEPENWTRGQISWARKAMKHIIGTAKKALLDGELPIVAHIPRPYGEEDNDSYRAFTASDLRTSTSHPLRHAALNVIRQLADHRARRSPSVAASPNSALNGTNYLLTSLTLFITHEPCIMCSMALLHSRVKEIFYLVPMNKTGGCGGVACLPRLQGVNHRFGISRWSDDDFDISVLDLDGCIDA